MFLSCTCRVTLNLGISGILTGMLLLNLSHRDMLVLRPCWKRQIFCRCTQKQDKGQFDRHKMTPTFFVQSSTDRKLLRGLFVLQRHRGSHHFHWNIDFILNSHTMKAVQGTRESRVFWLECTLNCLLRDSWGFTSKLWCVSFCHKHKKRS